MKETKILLSPPENYSWTALYRTKENPEAALKMIKDSGLRGRSGSCFPAGTKWELTAACPGDEKYVVCNADEGEPGTCKDRVLLECNPESVVEGIAICGAIVGAEKGYIYLREEYEHLRGRIENAITRMPGSFQIEIYLGRGSYICGEETALLESLEGKRGEPRAKPPFPSAEGLWGRPTVISNAETFANVPYIIEYGPEVFRQNGTAKHPGTKLVSLSGCIKNPGVYEFSLGTTIREMLEYAGGCTAGKRLKGLQVGGGSGMIVKPEVLDVAFDEESCRAEGITTGTGSILFFDEDCDVVGLCWSISSFFEDESCGKCTPCRLGNQKLATLLNELCNDRGSERHIEELKEIGEFMKLSSACGLGQVAAAPLLSAISNFEADFYKHIPSPRGLIEGCD